MSMKKLLRPFRKKLLWEGILRSALFGAATCGGALFLMGLVYRILIRQTPPLVWVSVGLAGFLAGSLTAFFKRFFPSDKKVAARVDALGLQERVSTMLEHRDDHSPMAQLQRRDAVKHIETVTPRQMRLRFPRKEILLSVIGLLLVLTVAVTPYNIFAFGASANMVSEEQARFVRELIAQMREDIGNSDLEDRMKKDLLAAVDRLEADLWHITNELEQAARIEQTKKEMAEIMKKAMSKYRIGKEMQAFPVTAPLGTVLQGTLLPPVSEALGDLKGVLLEDHTRISELKEAIDKSLEKSEVSPIDGLYKAFFYFSRSLSLLDSSRSSYPKDTEDAFRTAERAILEALEKQAQIEAEMLRLTDALTLAKSAVLGVEQKETEPETPSAETAGEETGEAEDPVSHEETEAGIEPDGEDPPPEDPDAGDGGSGGGSMMEEEEEQGTPIREEKIYDPFAGRVSYPEVFSSYYARYLYAIQRGDVSEDLQKLTDSYFAMLK